MPSRSRQRPDAVLPLPTESVGLPHAVFLERSPDDDNCADAAFMVLRLVDVLGVADQKSDQGFRYQTAATEQFCREQLGPGTETRSEEQSELQSLAYLVCRLLLEKQNINQ